jgi:hypothetical protein
MPLKLRNKHIQDSLKYLKMQDSIQILIADTIKNPDILIYKDKYDKMTYKKFDLDSVEKYHPLLVDTTIYSPSHILYQIDNDEFNKKGISTQFKFNCEACLDDFYVIYAYFLKRKTQNHYPKIKKQLFEAYQQINRYYGHWNNGGTYFGHQSWRIIGYAEFDLYNYIKYQEEEHIEPNYRKHKALFISVLKQRMLDKAKAEPYEFYKDKKTKMLDCINKIDKSIDNWFVLQKAILFEKQNYVYE